MSTRLFRLPTHPYLRLLLASACALPLVNAACSNEDDSGDTVVADYAVTITSIGDGAVSDDVALRCDGTVAVEVAISTSDASVPFILKPAYACGTSTRCGYVHLEALDADDSVLATVDTATLAGVLRLPAGAPPVTLRATLLSGVDREPLKNPDGEVITTSEQPSFVAASGCEVEGMGGAGGSGAGGEGGMPSEGGAPQGGTDAGGAGQGGVAQGGGDVGGAPAGGMSPGGAGGASGAP